jgi:hypothetical protein
MNEENPRDIGDIPPDRRTEDNPQGADPDAEDTNPERQGPDPGADPGNAPKPPDEPESSEPPPESIPGGEGQGPNPRQ